MTLILFMKQLHTRHVSMLILVLGAIVASNEASSTTALKYRSVSFQYYFCSYRNNGNGTSTIGVRIDFNNVNYAAVGSGKFQRRGLLLYAYDKTGTPKSTAFANAVYTGHERLSDVITGPDGSYAMYTTQYSRLWNGDIGFPEYIMIDFNNVHIAEWPAIGVRAGHIETPNNIADVRLVYIRADPTSNLCTIIINPENPPPPVIPKIDMTAPDWELGELLPTGLPIQKQFTDTAALLCFTYEGLKWTGSRYVINATNQNGLSGDGSYQLKHVDSPSDTVPYRVALLAPRTDTEVTLPNANNLTIALGDSGRECFTPTFTVVPARTAKSGAYNDVLNFTVVAKP
ncbi:hypothetical protein ACVCNH_05190 [Achromobacter anxifer]